MAKKKYTLTKKDICDLYGITMSKLEYHITKVKTKRSPHVFPEGVLINGMRHYNKADIEVYAKAAWTKNEAQKPLKLVKPITKAELAKELEPGLNALFGAELQNQETMEAVERSFMRAETELREKNKRQEKIIYALLGTIVAIMVAVIVT